MLIRLTMLCIKVINQISPAYGIRYTLFSCTKYFLSGRTYYATINNVNSKLLNVLHGVPPGNHLGTHTF